MTRDMPVIDIDILSVVPNGSQSPVMEPGSIYPRRRSRFFIPEQRNLDHMMSSCSLVVGRKSEAEENRSKGLRRAVTGLRLAAQALA